MTRNKTSTSTSTWTTTSARMTSRLLAGAIVLIMTAGACASAPPERLYALSSGVRGAAFPARSPARSVVVAPAVLPEIVDRPQLVLRTDENRIALLEQQRWAEPLRLGISRVVAEDLGQLLGTWRVSTRDEAIGNPDCRVSLDVRRFDTTRAGATVRVQTLWTVTCAGFAERTGQTATEERVAEPVAGTTFDAVAVVAAHGRALDSLSRDIADALRQLTPEVALAVP
jgi:uncharacterized lipoprotein YmbA